MATIRAYTTIEQSCKLAKFLPLESADMYYMETSCNNYTVGVLQRLEKDMLLKQAEYYKMFPCWSLAALEHLIWNTSVDAVSCPHIYKDRIANGYYVLYENYETNTCSSIVDACYEMILKLHKLNLL